MAVKASGKTQGKASKVFDPRNMFKAAAFNGRVWALIWPTLVAGKVLSKVSLVVACDKVNKAGGYPTDGPTQNAVAKAGQYASYCLRNDIFSHPKNETGSYLLHPRLVACVKSKASKAIKTPEQGAIQTTEQGAIQTNS